MDLNSLEDIKTVRLTEDYIQPRFQSCTSGEAHLAILDTSGSVWSTGALIQSGKLNKIKQFRILLTHVGAYLRGRMGNCPYSFSKILLILSQKM